jgi:hypothetical protein
MLLATHAENGVRIDEVSDGAHDAIRVSVVADALGDAGSPEMKIQLGDGRAQVVKASARTSEEVTFEVPVTSAPRSLRVEFETRGHFGFKQVGRFDNGGRGFGGGIEPLVGSPMVDAELAAFAERHGSSRAGSTAARLLAARTRLPGTHTPGHATIPKVLLRQTASTEEARTLLVRSLPGAQGKGGSSGTRRSPVRALRSGFSPRQPSLGVRNNVASRAGAFAVQTRQVNHGAR